MERHALVLIAAAFLAGCASAPTEVAKEAEVDRACVRDTGTRIEQPEGKCVASPGRVYTREDLERSGGIGTGEALKRIGVR
jgi:outer membrane cobalamin receptor